jgi:hypothetical protein
MSSNSPDEIILNKQKLNKQIPDTSRKESEAYVGIELRRLAVVIEEERYKLGELYSKSPNSPQTAQKLKVLEKMINEYMRSTRNAWT